MKRFLKVLIPLLIIGSLVALGYVYSKITSDGVQADEEMTEEERQRNLDWLDNIQGYSESDEVDEEEEEDATSTEDGTYESTTSTEDGSEEDALSDEEIMADEEIEVRQVGEDRVRGVENLGKADALESTEYDHAFDKLVLFAELNDNSISLEWNATESASFDEYKIVRSPTDENPYYPKTSSIKTISNIDKTFFTDKNVEPGTDYYYRICFTKTSGLPGCGNILKVAF